MQDGIQAAQELVGRLKLIRPAHTQARRFALWLGNTSGVLGVACDARLAHDHVDRSAKLRGAEPALIAPSPRIRALRILQEASYSDVTRCEVIDKALVV